MHSAGRFSVSSLLFGSKLDSFSRILYSFAARFDGVHAFGYKSAKSQQIWMKLEHSGYIARVLPWQILGAIRAVAQIAEPFEPNTALWAFLAIQPSS